MTDSDETRTVLSGERGKAEMEGRRGQVRSGEGATEEERCETEMDEEG